MRWCAVKFEFICSFSYYFVTPDFFRVKALLGAAQGLSDGSQHPLPWYPPVCVALDDIPEGTPKSYDHIVGVAERNKVPLKLTDDTMKAVS